MIANKGWVTNLKQTHNVIHTDTPSEKIRTSSISALYDAFIFIICQHWVRKMLPNSTLNRIRHQRRMVTIIAVRPCIFIVSTSISSLNNCLTFFLFVGYFSESVCPQMFFLAKLAYYRNSSFSCLNNICLQNYSTCSVRKVNYMQSFTTNLSQLILTVDTKLVLAVNTGLVLAFNTHVVCAGPLLNTSGQSCVSVCLLGYYLSIFGHATT